MAVYTIIRIYQVPAESQQQATDHMAEALALNTEKDYHVKDIIRGPRVLFDTIKVAHLPENVSLGILKRGQKPSR